MASEGRGTTPEEHHDRCTCGPCNPEECGEKHPTRGHYCNLDKGHADHHLDYEDRVAWGIDWTRGHR